MMKKDLQKVIVVALLFVALFGSYFLAKYISSLDGNDNASVAKWSVEAVSNVDTLNLVSGNIAGVYVLDVASLSEVSVSYSVILDNAPSGIEVKVDDGVYQTVGASGSITFDNVGSFVAGDTNSTHTHNITFNAPLETNVPSVNQVDIDVRFIQND